MDMWYMLNGIETIAIIWRLKVTIQGLEKTLMQFMSS